MNPEEKYLEDRHNKLDKFEEIMQNKLDKFEEYTKMIVGMKDIMNQILMIISH